MLRFVALTGLFVAVATVRAAEPVDWSKFVKHGEISGVVVKGDADKVVLEIPKLQQKSGNNGNNKGGKNRRPGTAVGHEHIDIHYAAPGLVRYEKIPEVSDGKGGTTKPTGKAFDALKLPVGAPGYAAERTDLKAGHQVTITLVRPSTVTAEKAKDEDIVIKYVMIKGVTTAPKQDGKDEPKKKK